MGRILWITTNATMNNTYEIQDHVTKKIKGNYNPVSYTHLDVYKRQSDNNVLHSFLQYSSQLLPSHYGMLLQWFIIKLYTFLHYLLKQ